MFENNVASDSALIVALGWDEFRECNEMRSTLGDGYDQDV